MDSRDSVTWSEQQRDIREEVLRLLRYLAKRLRSTSVQRHYKLEEWVAAEAFSFFDRRDHFLASSTVLPYATSVQDEKWCDLYVREMLDSNRVRRHLWFEFKAVPLGAAAEQQTAAKFARDVEALLGCHRKDTHDYWHAMKNPKKKKEGPTQEAWFRDVVKFPGRIDKGTFVGIAVLFKGYKKTEEWTALRAPVASNRSGVAPIGEYPELAACSGSRLGCLAYLVSMDGSPSPPVE